MSEANEEKKRNDLVLDLSKLHPEEREAVVGIIKSNTSAHKSATNSMMIYSVGVSILCGLLWGAALGSCGTVSKKDAILYGHGEEVNGEFRWKNHPEHEPKKVEEKK